MDIGPLIRLETTQRGINGITRKLGPEALNQIARDSLEESILELHRLVQEGTPQNTGDTAANIQFEINGSTINDLNGVVFSPDYHFKILNDGRRPGARMPPEGPIRVWMEDKGIDPVGIDETTGQSGRSVLFLIRRAIGRRGLPAHRIMEKALEQGRSHFAVVYMRRWMQAWRA